MNLDNYVRRFLNDSEISTGNSYYITNLSNIIYFSKFPNKTYEEPLSDELIQMINIFTSKKNLYLFIENKVIPIGKNKKQEKKCKSQIILPININGNVVGSLIMVNNKKKYNNNIIPEAITTVSFIETFISDYMKNI